MHDSRYFQATVNVYYFTVDLFLFRAIFYYRGDEMMAVRYGLYKAHYWTWTNSMAEVKEVSKLK